MTTPPVPHTATDEWGQILYTGPGSGPERDALVKFYADDVMAAVDDDREAGVFDRKGLPAPRSFADLHDHVDANCYLIQSEVPFSLTDDATLEFYVAVQDEVSRKLAAGPLEDESS